MSQNEAGQSRVLVMDGNERNVALLREFLADQGYEPIAVTDLEAADDVLADPPPIGVALVDVDRFDSRVWDRCRRLADRGIPFVVLSGVSSRSLAAKSRRRGSRSLVEKPVPKRDLVHLVETALGG